MSAAHAVALAETPAYLESHAEPFPVGGTLEELVHELRQPLSSIEAIAYYLEMTLPPEQIQARQYMRKLQQLVDQASLVLQTSVSQIRKPCGAAQRMRS